ncbi:MAG: hypothetical protein JW892_11220 [Anaerolineae bacterium]|nr:hypothetical protein [Anaerolineae bacterium]
MSEKAQGREGRGGRKRRWVWGLAILLVALLSVREAFDPYFIHLIGDALLPKRAPLTLELHEGLSFHLYADTRPHTGKIAALQKGLVLVRDGEAVIEEGYGFGLPLIQYGDLVYNARKAEVHAVDERTLVKVYTINVADRWSRFLRVKYKDVPALGTVTVTYTVTSPTTLRVDMDFTGLVVDWSAAYLMNEQGAMHFPIHENGAGEWQHGDEVGIWHASDDPFGCWISADETLRFCVETEPGRPRYVGRERYNQYNWVRIYKLSWSGIDLRLDTPVKHYSYVIHVESLDTTHIQEKAPEVSGE